MSTNSNQFYLSIFKHIQTKAHKTNIVNIMFLFLISIIVITYNVHVVLAIPLVFGFILNTLNIYDIYDVSRYYSYYLETGKCLYVD